MSWDVTGPKTIKKIELCEGLVNRIMYQYIL